jgi:AcrR family transcriptional regulator
VSAHSHEESALTVTAPTDRRAQLIEAAHRVIARRGFPAATTREIAAEAGVAEGTIYRYFTDKVDLCLAVVGDRLPELLRRLPEQAGRRSPRTVLIEFVTDALDAWTDIIPFLSGVTSDPELAKRFRERKQDDARSAHRGLSDYIEAEQAAGRIGAETDPRMLSKMLLSGAFHQAYMSAVVGESNLELQGKQFVEMLVEATLRAAGRGSR